MGCHLKKIGWLVVGVTGVVVWGMLMGMRNVEAANTMNFQAGYIISDFQMTDYNSMGEGEIQNFLSARNGCGNRDYNYYLQLSRKSGYKWHFANGHFVCLSEERFGDGEVIGSGETAAHIIYRAAQDYQINPKVLIVNLQKETGLITDPIPNNADYRKAMGYGCPDSGSCSSRYYGFKNQVRRAAELFRTVMNGGWTNYPVGNNYIQYNPNAACGGSIVNVRNRATSALYRYTPYQPNAGALAAGYGTASCGAYGNRNFYNYFEDWFGNITGEGGYVPFIWPRYMRVKNDTRTMITLTGELGENVARGRVLKFASKIYFRGKWYYRSEWATRNDVLIAVPAEALEEMPGYAPFINPRYMRLTRNTTRVNPYTGEAIDTLEKGRILKYTSKIEINGRAYYRTKWATDNNADWAVPAVDLGEVGETYEKMEGGYLKLKNNTERINPYTKEVADILEKGRILEYTSKIYIWGKWYYRTKWATNNNADMAVPAEALTTPTEIYEPFKIPREMRLLRNVIRVNPYTGEQIDELEQGRIIRYTSKICIGGKWYYRTEWATNNNVDLAVPAEALGEV